MNIPFIHMNSAINGGAEVNFMDANRLDVVRIDHAPEFYATSREVILAQSASRMN
jgi:hypothetical protein